MATVAIGGAENAGLLAGQILAGSHPEIAERIKSYRAAQTESVLNSPEAKSIEMSRPAAVTERILEPGSTLGVLGGGQLGAMFVGTAHRMGYRVAVWDPDADAPAHRIATHSFTAPFTDLGIRDQFASIVDAVTLEWENVPAELCEWLEGRCPMRPSGAVLRILQDRIEQKQYLSSRHLSVPAFAIVESTSSTGLSSRPSWPSHCL